MIAGGAGRVRGPFRASQYRIIAHRSDCFQGFISGASAMSAARLETLGRNWSATLRLGVVLTRRQRFFSNLGPGNLGAFSFAARIFGRGRARAADETRTQCGRLPGGAKGIRTANLSPMRSRISRSLNAEATRTAIGRKGEGFLYYSSLDALVGALDKEIIGPAEDRFDELVVRKAERCPSYDEVSFHRHPRSRVETDALSGPAHHRQSDTAPVSKSLRVVPRSPEENLSASLKAGIQSTRSRRQRTGQL